MEYGETVARALAGMDLGQTAVVKQRAAVALEAMEGTDETMARAGGSFSKSFAVRGLAAIKDAGISAQAQ